MRNLVVFRSLSRMRHVAVRRLLAGRASESDLPTPKVSRRAGKVVIGLVVLVVAALATTGVALALESTDPAPAAADVADSGDASDPAARIAELLTQLAAE